MNKLLILVLTLVFSTQVFASGRLGGSASNATARATNIQGQIQKQDARGGNASYAGNKNPNQAPSFGFGAMFPTAPCQATLGAGFSFMFGGGAAAGSRTLEQCEIRETIRTVIHMRNAGIQVGDSEKQLLCMTEHGAKISACRE